MALPAGRALQFTDLIGGKVVGADKDSITIRKDGTDFLIHAEIKSFGNTARAKLVWGLA